MTTLGASRVSRLDLSIGLAGSWRAEAWLDEGAQAPAGEQVLRVGDLEFVGTCSRGALDAPDAPHVVHVGAPEWGAVASAPLSWQHDAGVRLSTVLRDLASRAGVPASRIELPGDVMLGRGWAVAASRTGQPLRYVDALAALVAGRYVAPHRVDPDGVTRFGERMGGTVDPASVNVLRRDSAAGTAVLGADTFGAILPGATFEGALVERLDITERPQNLQATIWTRSPSPMTSILRAVSRRFPQLVYGYPRTYRVGAVHADGRMDLEPPADAAHLPRLPKVEQWTAGGTRVTPQIGSLAVVLFRDANPARPVATALQPLADSAPAKVEIDATAVRLGAAAATVLRDGDGVTLDTTTTPGRTFVRLDAGPLPARSKVKA